MKIIGHRGVKGLAPENSIESIRQALQLGVDAIELDIRMQGGSVVLSHDPIDKYRTYCPLKQALQEIDGKIPIVLDIKELAAVKPLIKAIKNYSGELVFSSHKYRTLQAVKKLVPDMQIAVIEKWSGVRAVAEATFLGTKRIHINHNWLWSKFVQSMKQEGYELHAYTVNDYKRAQELEKWGVDGIFTDNPKLVSE